MSESRYYDVENVMRMMECSQRKAYSIIRDLNTELQKIGKLTIAGKVPKAYFHHRYDITPEDFLRPITVHKKR